jgi:transposase
LKNESNLNVFKGEDVRLKKLLELNTPLTIAYVLKESLRQIWDHITYAGGKASLEGWIAAARASGINVLVSMANTMEKHSEGILNYFIYRVTSGQLEGLNNKIKVLIRRPYGYRNLEHFKRLVYAIKEFNPIKMFSSA